eukprot:1155915-Pelagomonas_calceolata.AAC.2
MRAASRRPCRQILTIVEALSSPCSTSSQHEWEEPEQCNRGSAEPPLTWIALDIGALLVS